jgi:chemotaxis protein CheD
MNIRMNHSDWLQIYLKPGELSCSTAPTRVTTVLGSCVSATLFHRPTGLAAICHAMQPQCARARTCLPDCVVRHRYADCAIEAMGHWMRGHNVLPREIEVKLFGGAAMMGKDAQARTNSMGQLNVQAALETLKRMGFALRVADVGGCVGRKIIFDTGSGEVWLKRLAPSAWAGRESILRSIA